MLTQVEVLGERSGLSDAIAIDLAKNRYLNAFRRISNPELIGIVERVLDAYAEWSGGSEDKLAGCRDFLANTCFAKSIPAVEAAYALYALRDGLLERLPSGDRASQNEARREVTKFFELLVVQLLRGR
jgi:hypothetical protein